MSNTISAMNLGIQGIQKAMDGLRNNAHQVASQNIQAAEPTATQAASPSVEESLVNLKMNKLQAQMSAKVVETSSDMLGTLLDIKA